jgi:phytanoyl-CoA hydroxylase
MIDLIRRLKLAYSVYNFFHKKELSHNEALLKKLGLNKRYYSPLSSRDFAGLTPPDTAAQNSTALSSTQLYQAATPAGKKSMAGFEENGYCILQNYLSGDLVDRINTEIKTLLELKKIKVAYGGKIMFAIHSSKLLRDVGNEHHLLELLSALLHGKAILFQSINFNMGSEQATHSDSIHMTTYPLGGLLGVWIALEDIDEDNGPLHYYPGSHKLPYYLNADYDNEGNTYLIGDKSYTEYEKMMERKIAEKGLKKEIFKARKGDLLIWHANLFHGGEAHTNKNKTRKSVVFHYFKENSICYHEITQRPALIKNFNKEDHHHH